MVQIKVTPQDVRDTAKLISNSISKVKLNTPDEDNKSDIQGNTKAKEKIELIQKTIENFTESMSNYVTLLNDYADKIEEEDVRESQGWGEK